MLTDIPIWLNNTKPGFIKTILAWLSILCISLTATSQQLQILPQHPYITKSHQFGFTTMEINYQAFQAPKSVGTSQNDQLEFSWPADVSLPQLMIDHDIVIQGEELEAGKYNLFLQPADDFWTIAFNRDSKVIPSEYDDQKDLLRLMTNPFTADIIETRLEFSIEQQAYNTGYLKIAFGNLRWFLSFQIDIIDDMNKHLDVMISENSADLANQYLIYSEFLLENSTDFIVALRYANECVEINPETPIGWWIKSQIEAKLQQLDDSRTSAEKTKELLEKQGDPDREWVAMVNQHLTALEQRISGSKQ